MVQASRLLLLVIVLIGSVTISEQTVAADPSNKVRIGYPSSAVSTLPFDIAKEKGFYSKAGLDVRIHSDAQRAGPAGDPQRQHPVLHVAAIGDQRRRGRLAASRGAVALSRHPMGAGDTQGDQQSPGPRRQAPRHLGHPLFALLLRPRRTAQTRLGGETS